MRIGNNMDMPVNEIQAAKTTANYSKADVIGNQIRLDITDIGKDTGLIIDQGRSIQNVLEQAGALDVQTQTDYMVVMSNTVSEEDFARMCKEGFHPGEMTADESVTILDHIKAVMAKSGDIVAGYNDDLDMAKLEQITGSRADANALAKAMKQADIPQNEANAKKINDAAREIGEVTNISDSAVRYMLENDLKPTIENVYRAGFSSAGNGTEQARGYYSLGMQGYLAKKADASDIDSIMSDIEKTVDSFELEEIDHETGVKEARWLLERGLNITKTNIEKLDELMSVKLPKDYEEAAERAAFALEQGKEPKKADLSKENISIYEKAADIAKKTEEIADERVGEVISKGQILNLKNLINAQESFGISASVSLSAAQSGLASNGQTLLQEVRLQMTLEANVSMLKKGIEIDTMPLSRLVDELKAANNNLDQTLMFKADGKNIDQNSQGMVSTLQVLKQTGKALSEIPFMPAAVIGRLKIEQSYSLTTVHEVGTDLKSRYEAAGQSYEALMTAPRRDMGDSITKAFRNVDDILADMGMDTDDDNRKAVRILGYNSMEITKEAITDIKDATGKVLNAVNALTPAKTLELIRQGIDPMDMDIDELTNVLGRMTDTEANEKYSRFLYKLEKNNDISESERSAFIGIYRLVNRLEKTDGAAIGALVNSDRQITLKSLLSGMRSAKASFNEKIDDDYGLLQNTVQKGISISDQIEQAFDGRIGYEKNESLNSEYIKESYKDYMDSLKANIDAADVLSGMSEPVTVANMEAEKALHSPQNNVFNLLKRHAKKDAVKETENAYKDYDSSLKSLMEGFEDRDSAKQAFNSLVESASSLIEDIRYTTDDIIDLKQMSLCNKQLSLALVRADRENYTVPMEINGETTAINLTLRHEPGSKGDVNIAFDSESYGRITVHFNVTDDSVKGLFITEKREGLEVLSSVSAAMSAKMDATTDFRVITGRENDTIGVSDDKNLQTSADINNVDTKRLYSIAKDFLTEFAGITGI